jgi:hypothetical protein
MQKPEPICPKCGSDQRKAPKRPSVKTPKPLVVVVEEEEPEEGMVPLEELEQVDADEEEEGGGGFRQGSGRERLIMDDLPNEDY